MSPGKLNPVIRAAFTVSPEVCVFADRAATAVAVHGTVHDKQVRARDRNAQRSVQPRDQGAGFHRSPEVVYSPIVPLPIELLPAFTTNTSDPETAMPVGLVNPVIRAAFTVAPEVVYTP